MTTNVKSVKPSPEALARWETDGGAPDKSTEARGEEHEANRGGLLRQPGTEKAISPQK